MHQGVGTGLSALGLLVSLHNSEPITALGTGKRQQKPEPGASVVEKQAERGKGHGLMVCTDRGEVVEASPAD